MTNLKLFKAFTVLFLIVYGPVLDTFLGPLLDISFLVCLFLIISSVVLYQRVPLDGFISGLAFFLLFIFLVCLLNVLLLDIENIEHSTRALLRPARVLVVLFAIAIFASYFVRDIGNNAIKKGIALLFVVILLHAVIMILQFFDENFRNMIYQYTEAKYVLGAYQATRMAGLTGAGGAQLSIIQSFGLVLGVYLFVNGRCVKTKLLVFIGCQLILASVFLAGRSGLLTAGIFCPIYYLYLNSQLLGIKSVKNTAIASAGFLLVIAVSSLYLRDILAENFYFMSAFRRIFDSFIAYNDRAEFKVNTLIELSNMFILPNEIGHLLIGKASYLLNNTLYSINTDIGYFRLVWGYGIVGSFFHYGFYIFAIYAVSVLPNISKSEKSVPIMLILLTLFFNMKEILVFSRMSFQFTMFVLFVVYYASRRTRVNLIVQDL